MVYRNNYNDVIKISLNGACLICRRFFTFEGRFLLNPQSQSKRDDENKSREESCIISKLEKKFFFYPVDFTRCINAARKIERRERNTGRLSGKETSIITITEAPFAAPSNVYFVVNAGRITSAR